MRLAAIGIAIGVGLAPHAAGAQGGDTTTAGALRGTVIDSTTMRPLAGATVQAALRSDITRGPYSATSDSSGAFHIFPMVPGEYVLTFFHPRLESLGLNGPLRAVHVGVRPDPSPVALAIPAGTRLVAGLCGPAGRLDSAGAIVGIVRDIRLGRPLPGAVVTVRWLELIVGANSGLQPVLREIASTSDGDGRFVTCAVPSDIELELRAAKGEARTGPVALNIDARSVTAQEFALDVGDSSMPHGTARRGSAIVEGVVRAANGMPLSGAHVEVAGTGVATLTTASGSYVLSELPAGTQTLEARAIGFLPLARTVTLRPGARVSIDIRFDSSAVTLPEVEVVATGRYERQLDAFEQARKSGRGAFLDQRTIAARGGSRTSDVLGTMPGVILRSSTETGGSSVFLRVSGRTRCRPTIFLDGVRHDGALVDIDVLVQPTDLVGIAVYRGRMGTPPEYVGVSNCGSVVLWTRLGTMRDEQQAVSDSTRKPPE